MSEDILDLGAVPSTSTKTYGGETGSTGILVYKTQMQTITLHHLVTP